jgi:hypothetical protein
MKFPNLVKKMGGNTFSKNSITDLWSKTMQRLLRTFVDWNVQSLSSMVFDHSLEWSSSGEPTTVSHVIPGLINNFWMIQQDILEIFEIPRKMPNEGSLKLPADDSWLSSVRGKGAKLEKDIERMFLQDKKASVEHAELTPQTAMLFVVKGVVQTLMELLRREVILETHTHHQIQVDIRCLRFACHLLLDNPTHFDYLLDRCVLSASDRCLEPSPADVELVNECIATMKGQLAFSIEN